MSETSAVKCDGCGKIAEQPSAGRSRPPYPLGWARLIVWGRPGDGTQSVQIGKVDICQPDCAGLALVPPMERLQ